MDFWDNHYFPPSLFKLGFRLWTLSFIYFDEGFNVYSCGYNLSFYMLFVLGRHFHSVFLVLFDLFLELVYRQVELEE